MLDPESMQVFTTVVQTGSFSKAGRVLNLAPSSVSRHVSLLEEELGSRLFNRTTRSMTLTDAGEIFQVHARRILADLEELQSLVRDQNETPTGTLRLSVPLVLGRLYLADAVLEYMRLWPEVNVELELTDRVVDLVAQGIDVGIRVGQLPDSTMVARKLGSLRRLVCGSPDYFEIHGMPRTPADLTQHNCMTFHIAEVSPLWRASGSVWRFSGPDGQHEISVEGDLMVNSADILLKAAVSGRGLILIVDWIARPQLSRGELIPVLTDYQTAPSARGEMGLYAVYPSARHAPAKVRTFIDHLYSYFEKQNMNSAT